MLKQALCDALVGRDAELSALEDAVLTVERDRSGGLVLLEGEAGMGKTRLAHELADRALTLGWTVLWGGCSEAEVALPYLPFVEALGNHFAARDPAEIHARLGGAARELSLLFPQLAVPDAPPAVGDAAQAKLRLFESVVTALRAAAGEGGVLCVVDDIHWADGSTRELLDHVARRLKDAPVLVLCTYRSDELQRRHPLLPTLQAWRRSRLAETVTLTPLPPLGVAGMIASIFDADEVADDFRDLIAARSEGNPFVVEEMLREAIERGDVYLDGGRWERRAVDELEIPDSVRETILLRIGRLDEAHVEVLRAAAVLGRTFAYGALVELVDAEEAVVQAALEEALGAQLVVEAAGATAGYSWRHALTQETVYNDTVRPRRQRLHERAAATLTATGAPAAEIARHLIEAGAPDRAVPACLAAADEAEHALALDEAAELLERVLPYLAELEHARATCRIAELRWLVGNPAAAVQLLPDAIARLAADAPAEVPPHRLLLGRAYWETDAHARALCEYELARDELEPRGPSADLAMAYVRLAGMHVFAMDHAAGRRAAERAIAVAEAAGAENERVWARSMLAIALVEEGDAERGLDLFGEIFDEAVARGLSLLTWHLNYNEIWTRAHVPLGRFDDVLDRLDHSPFHPYQIGSLEQLTAWAALAAGEPLRALEQAEAVHAIYRGHASKLEWRARVTIADALLDLDRVDEAAAILPPRVPGAEIQDVIYDASARIGIALARGRVDQAVSLAEEIRASERLRYPATVAHAVEALVAGGRADLAEGVVARAREWSPSPALAEASARIDLARGEAVQAAARIEPGLAQSAALGLGRWTRRLLLLRAEALAAAGDGEAARGALQELVDGATAAGALRAARAGTGLAARLGLELALPPELGERADAPELLPLGERLVTSLFADVRGYTGLAEAAAPAANADVLATLHRLAVTEVGRRHGIVDKFAGDAVMATFNATGARVDHTELAAEAALALRDKAALLDIPIGIGIAVGPAVVGRAVAGANVSVLGATTNLAARLQAAAGTGEIVLAEEAHRRLNGWLADRGLTAQHDVLELKGFAEPQPAYRLAGGPGRASLPG
jgi:class 3 adenylate cyclase